MVVLKKLLILLLSAALVLFMLKAPAVLDERLSQDIYLDWMRGEARQWEGIIRVWNVYTETENAGAGWLSSCVKKFEKKNKGVYVELVSCTAAGMQTRLERGYDPPDLWIYPESLQQLFAQGDVFFELPPPAKEKVLVSDFEFDIDAPDQQEEEPQEPPIRFCICASLQQEARRQEYSAAFAAFVASCAEDMIK